MVATSQSRGQASVEMLAALPALLLAGLVAVQLLLAGHGWLVADSAAAAGGVARAVGDDPEAAARRALPGWLREGALVESSASRVIVSVRLFTPLGWLGVRPRVASSFVVEERDEGGGRGR